MWWATEHELNNTNVVAFRIDCSTLQFGNVVKWDLCEMLFYAYWRAFLRGESDIPTKRCFLTSSVSHDNSSFNRLSRFRRGVLLWVQIWVLVVKLLFRVWLSVRIGLVGTEPGLPMHLFISRLVEPACSWAQIHSTHKTWFIVNIIYLLEFCVPTCDSFSDFQLGTLWPDRTES